MAGQLLPIILAVNAVALPAAGPHSAFSHHVTPFSAGRGSASLPHAAPSSTAAPAAREPLEAAQHEEVTPDAAEPGSAKKRPRLPDSQADSMPQSGSAQRPGSGHQPARKQLTPEPQQRLGRTVSFEHDGTQGGDRDGSLPPHLASRSEAQLHPRGASPIGPRSISSEDLPPGFGSSSAAARAKDVAAAADDGKAVQVEQLLLAEALIGATL